MSLLFLSYNMLSEGILNDTLPARQEYSYLEFNDSNSSLKIDALHVQDYEIDDDTILAVDSEESWNMHSIILGNFENTLESGSIVVSIPYPLTNYIIRRKEVGGSLNPILTTLDYDRDLVTYTDYTPRNNVNYIYTLSPYYSDGSDSGYIEGRGLTNNQEIGDKVSFWGYTLSDVASTPTTQYLFDMEIESGEVNVVTDFKKYDNYTQFPTARFGNRRYKEGSLRTIPYTFNSGTDTYTIDITLLDEIEAFINNKGTKLLRNPAGEAIYCITTNFSYKYNDKIPEQPYTINFSWIQIA